HGAAVRAVSARLELRRTVIDGGENGVLAEKGSTSLEDCALRGQAGAAAFQNGGTLAISGGEIEGPGTGVRLSQGRLEMSRARLEGARMSVECAGSASLVWRLGSLTGGGVSLGSGVEGELEGIAIKSSFGHGAQVSGGRLIASGCLFEDAAQAGVYVSDGGSAELTDCSLRRLRYGVGVAEGDARLEDVRISGASEVGFTAGSGRHRLARVVFHGCADRIHAADGALIELVEDAADEGGASAALKRALREAVLRTRRLPFFGTAYRAMYALPVRVLQLLAVLDGNTAALYAHRSWTRRDWDPGLSDVDLIVAARDLSGEAGRRWLERFWNGFLWLKRGFPFLSECLVVEPVELDGYAQWGGFRSRGFVDQLAPLNGALPLTGARPASPKAALEPVGEMAHAYTRLMSSALWRPEPSRAGRSSARNAALDVLRLSAANAEAGPAGLMAREAALAASGAALRAPLATLAAAESARARAEICAAGLMGLHDGASRLLAAWPAPGESNLRWADAVAESSPGGDIELRRRRGLAEEYARACGGALVAGCADDVYRTCLVLDDAAASPQTLSGVFEGLSRLISLRGEPATLPIVLTASAWKIWSRLAYLESPARFLEPGGGPGDFLIRAGAPLPGAWQYAWGREHLTPAPAPDALVLDLARESLATLRCVWRYQSSAASPLSKGYIQHYLLGRTMGLRLLLERGVGSSFFALEPLRALYAREFPERVAPLERLWARLAERDGPAPWTELYAWVDEELRS
ncbi:MAG: right-handed parallel beta-helix repeat-containing protein, partial [Elusimicrobiota bacterium]